jgi:hypothetical protein
MGHRGGIVHPIQVPACYSRDLYIHRIFLSDRRGRGHETSPPPGSLPDLSSMISLYNPLHGLLGASIALHAVSGNLIWWIYLAARKITWGKMSWCKHGKCIHNPLLLGLGLLFGQELSSFRRDSHIDLHC